VFVSNNKETLRAFGESNLTMFVRSKMDNHMKKFFVQELTRKEFKSLPEKSELSKRQKALTA